MIQNTIQEGRDQIYSVQFSTQKIQERTRNELDFFEKRDGEFTNIKSPKSFPRMEKFWLKGISADVYNEDGVPINWRAVNGLRKFFNQATLDIHISSKVYIDKLPMRQLFQVPEIAGNSTSLAMVRNAGEMLLLPQAMEIIGGLDFHVRVIGVAGEYLPAEGFSASTRLMLNLHGILGRPLQ